MIWIIGLSVFYLFMGIITYGLELHRWENRNRTRWASISEYNFDSGTQGLALFAAFFWPILIWAVLTEEGIRPLGLTFRRRRFTEEENPQYFEDRRMPDPFEELERLGRLITDEIEDRPKKKKKKKKAQKQKKKPEPFRPMGNNRLIEID